MSEALPLSPRPNLEQYKKLAKDLQSACKSNDPDAVRGWAARWAERIARLHGLKIAPQSIEQRWHESTKGTLSDAQFFLAREHGFASWPKFAEHLEALARADSPVSRFEAAADTIVAGDVAALQTLLRENPELIRARSTREHRSTLLHYVSANGVEDFRQKTPKNILEVTELLLKAGADVDAESDAYGGRSTALGLTATSWHPEKAGVQLALMELLIGHGAAIDPPDGGSAVNACLGNGRGEAAEFLANHGARLDLEGAAGVGRLDVVRNLQPLATPKQMREAFAWACQFGRTSVVDFLLQTGMDVQAKLPHHGQTGLHWAAYGGHADTVRLLLERGAPIDAKDERYDGTALAWALYAWQRSPHAAHYEVVALLARAGADEAERRQYTEEVRHDPRMLAALRGEDPPNPSATITS